MIWSSLTKYTPHFKFRKRKYFTVEEGAAANASCSKEILVHASKYRPSQKNKIRLKSCKIQVLLQNEIKNNKKTQKKLCSL